MHAATIAAAAAFAFVAATHGDMVAIESNGSASTSSLGAFTGMLDWNYSSGTSGVLTVSLTNTTPAANGGWLTAFLFNIDSIDPLATAVLASSTDPDFLNITGGGLNGAPFGNPFDAGAGLGGDFLGNGNPSAGLAIGATGTFVFNVTASDASLLSATSFLNGPYDENFIVRFRGFANGGSDKVPAQLVPGPATLALFAVGFGRRRRRRA